MNIPKDTTNDTKTLIAVGALVVGGMVGLAVLAGLGSTPDEATDADRPVAAANDERQSRPLPAPAMPASIERPSVERVELQVPEVPEVEPEPQRPDDPVASGLANYRARAFDAAASDFSFAVESRPQDGWTRYMLGLSLWKSGSLEEAAAAMDQAARLDPHSIKPLVNLSRIENDRGDYDAAVEAARAALAIEPDNATALFLEGRSLRNLGMDDEAEESLRASLVAGPDNGYAHNLLGLLLIETDRAEQAIEPLRSAAELQPEIGFIHNNLGMALERAGDREAAVSAYARAVEVDPSHRRASVNLARLGGVDPAEGPEITEETQVAVLTEEVDTP